MSADVRLGHPSRYGFPFRDANGSLVTSGVTGAVSLYGPGSTSAIEGPTDPPTHLGGGVWGLALAASDLATAGLYRLSAPALTNGTVTYGQQDLYFVVGPSSPNYRTLRECLEDLGVELDWALPGTTTGNGSTTTLVDSGRANSNLSSDEWVDSELLILEPGAATDRNPVTVTAFAPTTGTFTFTPAITSTTTGQDYLILNARGSGRSYGRLRRAILAAWREAAPVHHVVDTVNWTTDGTYALAAPAQWRGIDAIHWRASTAGPWSEIAGHYAAFDAARGVLDFALPVPAGRTLRVAGRVAAHEPQNLTDVVQVPYSWLRDRVLGELLAQSERREDQQRAAVHLERAERRRPR